MTTDSLSPSRDAAAPTHRIPDVIYRSVKTALTLQCRRRHDTDVTIRRRKRTAANQPTEVRLECGDDVHMTVRIRVQHVGGNVYDVECEIKNGPSRTFTYSLPRYGGTTLSRAPCLGRKLGTFLLENLEQQIGRHHLRGG